jgi:hypothetical protein
LRQQVTVSFKNSFLVGVSSVGAILLAPTEIVNRFCAVSKAYHTVKKQQNAILVVGLIGIAFLEFFPKKVLGTIMLNPHPFADASKRHPEVETLLVTRDNHTEVVNKVLNWLM